MKLQSLSQEETPFDDVQADPEPDEPSPEFEGLSILLGANSTNSTITDGELLSSMRYNALLGFTCLVIFGILNAVFKMYRIRLVKDTPSTTLQSALPL